MKCHLLPIFKQFETKKQTDKDKEYIYMDTKLPIASSEWDKNDQFYYFFFILKCQGKRLNKVNVRS